MSLLSKFYTSYGYRHHLTLPLEEIGYKALSMIHKPTHTAITMKIRRDLFRNSDLAYIARTLLIGMCQLLTLFSIYTLSDLGVLSNLIGSLSLANEHYSPPTE